MGRSDVFPKLVISMIKIGEETGQLSFMLEKLAVFYKQEVEATVSALTKAMEPAVIFVVAGIVGTIVISLYLPMFSLISKHGRLIFSSKSQLAKILQAIIRIGLSDGFTSSLDCSWLSSTSEARLKSGINNPS